MRQPVPEPVSGGDEDPPVEEEDEDERDVEGRHRREDLVADVLTDLKKNNIFCCLLNFCFILEFQCFDKFEVIVHWYMYLNCTGS